MRHTEKINVQQINRVDINKYIFPFVCLNAFVAAVCAPIHISDALCAAGDVGLVFALVETSNNSERARAQLIH